MQRGDLRSILVQPAGQGLMAEHDQGSGKRCRASFLCPVAFRMIGLAPFPFTNRDEHLREEFNCKRQYNEGKYKVSSQVEESAVHTTLNPAEAGAGEPDLRGGSHMRKASLSLSPSANLACVNGSLR
jgi:hypothetical protein